MKTIVAVRPWPIYCPGRVGLSIPRFSPHRYLGVALLDQNPYIQGASFSNSIGLNYTNRRANAGIRMNLKDDDGKESPIGAELKGSAEAKGAIDFLFTSYTYSDQLDSACLCSRDWSWCFSRGGF